MLTLGHRGCTRAAPENTWEAFEAALAAGLDGCETDVRRCADGSLVLVHDERLADGRRVADLDRVTLEAALGHAVPTADEVLARWPDAVWNLEVKDQAAAVPLLHVLRRHDLERVLVTSFDHPVAMRFALESQAGAGVLIAHRPLRGVTPFAAWRRSGIGTLVLPFPFLAAWLVEEAAQAGMNVGAWGLSGTEQQAQARAAGAAILIVD
ncbi:MAG: glycerophosphodiester phosphodiesterase [Planctomycetota bacterium]